MSKLETLIRSPGDFALFRSNALQFAADKNVGEPAAIDLFLVFTTLGIFEMDWHLVCPSCATRAYRRCRLRCGHVLPHIHQCASTSHLLGACQQPPRHFLSHVLLAAVRTNSGRHAFDYQR